MLVIRRLVIFTLLVLILCIGVSATANSYLDTYCPDLQTGYGGNANAFCADNDMIVCKGTGANGCPSAGDTLTCTQINNQQNPITVEAFGGGSYSLISFNKESACNAQPGCLYSGGNCIQYGVTTCSALQTAITNNENITLAGNIDCSGTTFSSWTNKVYSKTVNGANYNISNVFINELGNSQTGLFSRLEGATLINFNLINATVIGGTYTGGLFGYSISSTIENVSVNANVTGASWVGTFGGKTSPAYPIGTIRNSRSTGRVSGSVSVGGFIGSTEFINILNSFSSATASGSSQIGGFAGVITTNSVVNNSYSSGTVTATNDWAGGFAGIKNSGIVDRSYTSSTINAPQKGGFAGGIGGTILNSYFDQEKAGTNSEGAVGTSTGVTNKTTTQMKQQATYTNWDFTNKWQMLNDATYPHLFYETLSDFIPDTDGDGVDDYLDNLLGDSANALNSIKTSGISASIQIADNDSSIGLEKTYSDNQTIIIKDGTNPIITTNYNFSKRQLNLSKINITKTNKALLIKGFNITDNKTINISINSPAICVKDSQAQSILAYSQGCDQSDEGLFTQTECIGTSTKSINGNQITCNYIAGNYIISGLKHTLVVGVSAKLNVTDDKNQIADVSQNITFFANYTSISTGNLITGANCTIEFNSNGSIYNYTETSSKYEYNLTSGLSAGIHSTNTTCKADGFDNLSVIHTFTLTNNGPIVNNTQFPLISQGGLTTDFSGQTDFDYYGNFTIGHPNQSAITVNVTFNLTKQKIGYIDGQLENLFTLNQTREYAGANLTGSLLSFKDNFTNITNMNLSFFNANCNGYRIYGNKTFLTQLETADHITETENITNVECADSTVTFSYDGTDNYTSFYVLSDSQAPKTEYIRIQGNNETEINYSDNYNISYFFEDDQPYLGESNDIDTINFTIRDETGTIIFNLVTVTIGNPDLGNYSIHELNPGNYTLEFNVTDLALNTLDTSLEIRILPDRINPNITNLNRTNGDKFDYTIEEINQFHQFNISTDDNSDIQYVEFTIINITNYQSTFITYDDNITPDFVAMAVNTTSTNYFEAKNNVTLFNKCVEVVINCDTDSSEFSYHSSINNATTFILNKVNDQITSEAAVGQCTNNVSALIGFQLTPGNVVASNDEIVNASSQCPGEINDAYLNISKIPNKEIAKSTEDNQIYNISSTPDTNFSLNFTNTIFDLLENKTDYIYLWNILDVYNNSNNTFGTLNLSLVPIDINITLLLNNKTQNITNQTIYNTTLYSNLTKPFGANYTIFVNQTESFTQYNLSDAFELNISSLIAQNVSIDFLFIGNASYKSKSLNYTIELIDTISPTIINLNVTNITKTNATIRFNQTNASDFDRYEIYLDETLIINTSNVTNTTHRLTNLTNSTQYSIIVTTYDINGNKQNATKSFATEGSILELVSNSKSNNSLINLTSEFEIVFSNTLSRSNISLLVNNQSVSYTKEIHNNTIKLISLKPFQGNSVVTLVIGGDTNDTANIKLNQTVTFNYSTVSRDTDFDGISDTLSLDVDGDGLANANDSIIGNETILHTNLENITILVNNTQVENKTYNSSQRLVIKSNNVTILDLYHDFSAGVLDLANISIVKQKNPLEDEYYLFISGVDQEKSSGFEYNTTTDYALCIIDESEINPDNFTQDCTGNNEQYIICDARTESGYYCNYQNKTFNITGLQHSALKTQCAEDWVVGSFGTCNGGTQTRSVTDQNSCGTTFTKPSSSQSCTVTSTSGGGGGGGSSKSLTTTAPATPEEITEEKEIEKEISQTNTKEEETKVSPKTEQTGGSNECSISNINFNNLNNCGFEKLNKKHNINGETNFQIENGVIYYDKNTETYYITKETTFYYKNINPNYQPTFVFQDKRELNSKARELLVDIAKENIIIIVKDGEVSFKELNNQVQVIKSGNAFITNTITGKIYQSAFREDQDINDVLNNIKSQIEEHNGEIEFIELQLPSAEERPSDLKNIFKIIIFMTLGSFAVVYSIKNGPEWKKAYEDSYEEYRDRSAERREELFKPSIQAIIQKRNKIAISKRKAEVVKNKKTQTKEKSKLPKDYFDNMHEKIDKMYLSGKIDKVKYKELTKKLIDTELLSLNEQFED